MNFLGRRSLVRPDNPDQFKRSSSLPPEADSNTNNTRAPSRGRSTANPIGLSRRSSDFKYNANDSGHGGNGQRSHSLTRSLTGTTGGNNNKREGLSRSSSFASVGSYGSDIQEPGWFAHAFHGSGACTCGIDHAGQNCDDAKAEKESKEKDNNVGASFSDDGSDHNDSADSDMKRLDSATENTAESTLSNNSTESSSSPNNSSSSIMSSSNNPARTKRNKEGGQQQHQQSTSTTGTSSSSSIATTKTIPPQQSQSYSASEGNISSYDASTITSANLPSLGNSTSTNSTFTGHDQSIQSELLNDGEESSLSYHPKSTARNSQQQHENDVSSITMESNGKPVRQKSFVNKVKENTINKIRKKMKEDSFNKSENSMGSRGSTNSEQNRRRGRSLGLKSKRRSTANDVAKSNNNNGNSHPYRKRRSRSQTHVTEYDGVDQEGVYDRRVRERSRSIVRDAQSLIAMIDGKKEDNMGSAHTFESIDSGSSTVVTNNNNHVTSSSRGGGVFLRNKQKGQHTPRQLQERRTQQNRLSIGSLASDSNSIEIDHLDQSENTLDRLSSLHKTNQQNEDTIQKLQQQLTDITNERNAFRNNSERMMDIMTKQKTQLEKELHSERRGFADVTHSHKQEIEEWKGKLKRSERKCKDVEAKLKSKQETEGMEKLREVRGIREKTSSPKAADGDAKADDTASYDLTSNVPLEKEASFLASTLGLDISSLSNDGTTLSQEQRNLRRAILKLSEMESNYNAQLQQLESETVNLSEEMDALKNKHNRLEKQHLDLLEERDDEAAVVNVLESKLEGCRIVIESMKNNQDQNAHATDASSASALNDELVEKVGDLADENGQLLSKCNKLERELSTSKASLEASVQNLIQDLESVQRKHDEATATIETLQMENRNLRVTFENQGKKSNQQMKYLVKNLRSSLNGTDDGSVQYSDLDEDSEDNSAKSSRGKKNKLKHITEMEHKDALSRLQDMQDENDALHESMEEAIDMASDMKVKMAKFVSMHETTVREYDSKLGKMKEEYQEMRLSKEELSTKLETLRRENKSLTAELDEANSLVASSSSRDEIEIEKQNSLKREKRELSAAMENLHKENEKLHESMKEMNSLVATAEECVGKLSAENASLKDAQEYYEQQLQEINVEREANEYLRQEIKSVSTEREDAYDTCKVLQQEVDMLRRQLKESKGRVERLSSTGDLALEGGASSLSKENQEKLDDLTRKNKSLTKELEQKNKALQAVQLALENLKEEQGTIKETIVELRTENARLREMPPALPSSPHSILRRGGSHDGSNNSIASTEKQVHKLESRIKKVEKENKGLREANSTLSAKLFDEMEKTDALRVANEGLAARICKLVAFIQQNPGGGEQGSGSGGASSTSSRSLANSKKSKVPPAPKKKK
mmetsp:Transcript_11564/g.24659  ORF Transcript_11564/g.24659 Transcript_11564/m.24659 type:complete len:1393 (+) Transcript_11564:306-4484(+)|eukprot:CAMPEP_0183709938 /NCGR_PEP_ID=MMETSP0737-20130205/5866_1 /TAXON_ID=385413 /ORGANISM="Thalassiosira miniscula, Strain CCMP1093" /LENGTH=1392 /DNA_ID=CAMNT_0025938157 /DNA_START=271 /DNA_END=4449 /DNA_ORIENTATION=+